MYSIHYTAIEPIKEESRDINITDASVTSYELHLQYSKTYQVVAFTWNDLGRSSQSNKWQLKTAQGKDKFPLSYINYTTRNVPIRWVCPLYITGRGLTLMVKHSTLQLTFPTKYQPTPGTILPPNY